MEKKKSIDKERAEDQEAQRRLRDRARRSLVILGEAIGRKNSTGFLDLVGIRPQP